MTERTVAYVRATRGSRPTEEEQIAAIGAWEAVSGERVQTIYRDTPGRSGGRDALVLAVAAGRIARIVVARPCRLATSVAGLLRLLALFRAAKIELVAVEFADQAATEAMVVAAPAIEAARKGQKQEAVAQGRARARARGIQFGRPTLRRDQIERVAEALAQGASVRAAARAAGVGVASAHRIKAAISEAART